MTRQEFIDEVTTWSELKDFCYDVNCDYCDEVYSADSRDEYINEDLADMARNVYSWQELLEQLQDISTSWDYYIRDDYGEWSGTDDGDDTFGEYKDDVLEWMDNNDYWDEEDDEGEEVEEEPAPDDDEDPEDEEPVEEEDVSIAELFTTCNSKLQKIDADTEAAARAAEEEDEEAFNDFCAEVGVTVTVEIKGGNA